MPGGQADGCVRGRPAARGAQLARRTVERGADRLVEAPQAGVAGRERDVDVLLKTLRGIDQPVNHDRVRKRRPGQKGLKLCNRQRLAEHAFDLCADLARRYGAKLGMRTLDSLHVACALELNAERFWTFDERQAKLARAEGLKTA